MAATRSKVNHTETNGENQDFSSMVFETQNIGNFTYRDVYTVVEIRERGWANNKNHGTISRGRKESMCHNMAFV